MCPALESYEVGGGLGFRVLVEDPPRLGSFFVVCDRTLPPSVQVCARLGKCLRLSTHSTSVYLLLTPENA